MVRIVLFGLIIANTAVFVPRAPGADPSGLLGYWKFDSQQGDVAVDSSRNGNDGDTWGTQWVKGQFGTALRFDGQGAHVSIPAMAGLDGSAQLTVEAWVLWEGTAKYPNILTGGTWSPGGFMMFVADQQCSFRMGRPGASAAKSPQKWRETSARLIAPITLGKWYHIAATFHRPTLKTFVNGKLVQSTKWDYPVGLQGDILIGKWSGKIGHKGLIDEVRIYNRARTAEQIMASFREHVVGRAASDSGSASYEVIPRSTSLAHSATVLENEYAKLAISRQGRCLALIDKQTGQNQIARTLPLVSLQRDGRQYSHCKCSFEDGKLIFRFQRASTIVTVNVETNPGYFVFKVASVEGPRPDQLTFLNLSLLPRPYVNQTSGLAADDQFAVCLRALNLQTRVRVAGSSPSLQASVRQPSMPIGAGIALATCPTSRIRDVLQKIVQHEDIVYSKLGGPFALDARENRGSYVFARVSEKNVEQWIELARRGGIRTVHMSGWEQSLGHYSPQSSLFPHGIEGMKKVVDQLHAAGLKVGIHTLTGCISPHDPWVRPNPDPRLATDGTFQLMTDLKEKGTLVPTVAAPGNFPTVWAYGSRGNCIRIDDELIQYSAISNTLPFGFLKCRRGAFGTRAAPHKRGAKVEHMFVRYGCFVPDENSTLVNDVASAIAKVYNTCQLDQIYMDGAEAMRGWYGIARMRQAIFKRLARPALVEASCWDHHSWPFHSRIGAWDHPKWGLKRFADDHLAAVQHYRRAALLEAQLGWWVILGPSRDWHMEMPDEIEYLCAKALGYDAPLSFQGIQMTANPSNARQTEYFTTIGRYERLRLANYFTDSVRRQLRNGRDEFHLVQADDGEWQFLPSDYKKQKITSLRNETNRWASENRFAAQPLKLRIEALYSAVPYDDHENKLIADFTDRSALQTAVAAPHVQCRYEPTEDSHDPGTHSARLVAMNSNSSPVGAWARMLKPFNPVIDLTPYDAIGLWVYGDGNGELINLQLTNLPEYFRTLDDHYISVDFQGWRYFELFMRERDAAAYHDFQWPYGAHCVLHRSPLVRHAVNQLAIYLNNLPPKKEVHCRLGPIKALKTRKIVLRNPAITVNGKTIRFPIDLESGMFIEFDSADNCRLYDEQGNLVQWLHPTGETPILLAGTNDTMFSCEGCAGFRTRAEVTIISRGGPLRGRRPDAEIDWSLLNRQYESPRTIGAIDGHQNQWEVFCRPSSEQAGMRIELEVKKLGSPIDSYRSTSARALTDFDKSELPATHPTPIATYKVDPAPTATSCKTGVKQQLTRATDIVRTGKASLRYVATSVRDDNAGWSVKNGPFQTPIDLSPFHAIGFWVHGDGNGQSLKLQLHDADGGWQDHYTKIDFQGWRYCHFPLGGPRLKTLSKITALNIYYNGIPARNTVRCYIDGIRAIPATKPLEHLEMTVAGQRIRFPGALREGDRLTLNNRGQCRVRHSSGDVDTLPLKIDRIQLRSGNNPVTLSMPPGHPNPFRISVSTTVVYP